jgi:signal transduction histidine kinase
MEAEANTREGGLYVEEDGTGIPTENREHIFERGFSTIEEGLGIGLNIVQAIVTVHGWDVAAKTGTDGGARFEVTGVSFATEVVEN